nr:MAG TPA: hypothetical protein [Caudoviricetes sp.]
MLLSYLSLFILLCFPYISLLLINSINSILI